MNNFCGQDIINCLEQMKYLLKYSFSSDIKVLVSVDLVSANPGEGQMVDCIVIKASNEPDESGRQKSITAEIFAFSENQSPRLNVIESYTLSAKP